MEMKNENARVFEGEIAVEMVDCGANAISVGSDDCWVDPNPTPTRPKD